jgi:RimJ/RimL family protein N-acetyltransferase
MPIVADSVARTAPPIRTARLQLRAPDERDLAAFERMFTDPDVMHHYARFALPGAGARWLAALRRCAATDGSLPWTVELHDGTFVGQCGPLLQDVEGSREVEIICFFERPFWRAGYADEAARAAIAAVFERSAAPRIVGLMYPRNRPSVRLALRCGLHFERLVDKDGEPMALYVLEREAFSATPPRGA